MKGPTALLTFGIGPVHEFIAAARRVADVWAGSDLLSHLMGRAIDAAGREGGGPVFPDVAPGSEPTGLPNRVVVRVPLERAEAVAEAMGRAVEERWAELAGSAVQVLRDHGIEPGKALWPADPGPERPRQTDRVFQLSWSWVAEDGDYAAAARAGARRYAASRLFRPFEPVEQRGEKCALCGTRTALPDGDRGTVRRAWQEAEGQAEERGEAGDERFFRFDQGRLCLVCATKRLYTRSPERKVYFVALTDFDEAVGQKAGAGDSGPGGATGRGAGKGPRPSRRVDDDRRRYVAVVTLDGDRMSEVLAWGAEELAGGAQAVEDFHRELSGALSGFAQGLRTPRRPGGDSLKHAQLDLDFLGIDSTVPFKQRPQLLYAGGDDVLVVCSPADALQVARAVREKFLEAVRPLRSQLRKPADLDRLTLSGAVVFAHAKHPAGLLFREAHDLLTRKAKGESGRDSLALRLIKRSGVPVEVAFKWQDAPGELGRSSWLEAMNDLAERLRSGRLSSSQTFNLRREEAVLQEVFGQATTERWEPWLADRLSRGQGPSAEARELARRIAPFFAHRKAEALRIVRFLGVEMKA